MTTDVNQLAIEISIFWRLESLRITIESSSIWINLAVDPDSFSIVFTVELFIAT